MGKFYSPERYSRKVIGILAVLSINNFTGKDPNTHENSFILEISPQVTNYEYVGPLTPVFEDPMHNVYRMMGIEPNNYEKPEELHKAVEEQYNKLLNK